MNRGEQFIADCWTIVRAFGRTDAKLAMQAQVGWGMKSLGATCYKDKFIEIVAEAAPSKRILVNNITAHNPVLCTDKDGEPFRWHGQYAQIAAHVRTLAVGIKAEES